ncbi:GPR1/FUN34/yaaH family-domain-containing protein [Chlamydoabsidia padenii]|nr:GPR1/FUN34/yaaH family-domain-containing protein [Chlamydoabsidia padenii]
MSQGNDPEDIREEGNRYEDRLSLPEASRYDEKALRDVGNMYAAYNMMVRTASPVVNGQKSERPLHMGNPSVIGLWSFAMVTILLGIDRLFLPWKPINMLLPTALMFGGLSQLVAGFLDLFVGGTFSGTILVSYGAFWTGRGIMFFPDAETGSTRMYADPMDAIQADAIYDIIWALYTFMLVCLSLKIRSGEHMVRASGVCCILAALGAFYSGIAAVLEEQSQHCPVGHYPWTKNV